LADEVLLWPALNLISLRSSTFINCCYCTSEVTVARTWCDARTQYRILWCFYYNRAVLDDGQSWWRFIYETVLQTSERTTRGACQQRYCLLAFMPRLGSNRSGQYRYDVCGLGGSGMLAVLPYPCAS
jgi:hypothetical protein